jgi:hypothetical protein
MHKNRVAPRIPLRNVRVYLVAYIFYIIDYYICRDIFSKINIMYCRLAYVSGGALSFKTFVLYIYRPRGTIQYNQQLYVVHSFNMISELRFFLILEVFRCL